MFKQEGLQPDHYVFACLVKACAILGAIKQGNQVHASFIVSPVSDDDVVKSSLVDMYAKCGLPDIGHVVFDSISSKNTISWTALISGYAQSGRKIGCYSAIPENANEELTFLQL